MALLMLSLAQLISFTLMLPLVLLAPLCKDQYALKFLVAFEMVCNLMRLSLLLAFSNKIIQTTIVVIYGHAKNKALAGMRSVIIVPVKESETKAKEEAKEQKSAKEELKEQKCPAKDNKKRMDSFEVSSSTDSSAEASSASTADAEGI